MKMRVLLLSLAAVTFAFTGCKKSDSSNSLFPEPQTSWGYTQAQLTSKLGTPDDTETDTDTGDIYLLYNIDNKVCSGHEYIIFADDNKLHASAALVDASESDIESFLSSKYTKLDLSQLGLPSELLASVLSAYVNSSQTTIVVIEYNSDYDSYMVEYGDVNYASEGALAPARSAGAAQINAAALLPLLKGR